ncbi:phage tail tube protein [Falsiroseomonas sp.]|uniref:phage tail tube protein n=1 Tax=Falsiroseomonas sp. TaxID=2870721 RepID=UPI002735253E|nr:phage tail tube protein [Falsiroseomonas sp.]MDP3417852.1 phage tail tube protein [Falsiroseomonas sp.]
MGLYQTGRNIVVAYKARAAGAYGDAAAGGAGAAVFRPSTGGLNLTKGAIESAENRRDGMRTRGRHGQHAVAGSYQAELSVGSFDDLFAAAFRASWSAAVTITQATAGMSTATLSCTTSAITASAGSWITSGLRVGDVIVFSTGLTGNTNRNLRVVGLTATVITVAETLAAVAGPVSTWSVSVRRKLIQSPTLAETDFSFEEHELDIDASERFDGVRVTGFSLEMAPNSIITATFNLIGQKMTVLGNAEAPYFTAPTASVTLPLSVVDASIRLGTENLVDLTGFSLNYDLNAGPTEVIASRFTPDVFTNQATVTGSITGLRKNLNQVTSFLNEDQIALHVLCAENEAEPKDFFSLSITNLTLGGANKSALGADGPRTQELPIMVGIDEAGGAFDATMLKLVRSNA